MDKEQIDLNRSRRRPTRAPADTDQADGGVRAAAGNRAFTGVARSAVHRSDLPTQGAGELDDGIADAIETRRGHGAPLGDAVRADMEGHLGADLADVRVHTDSAAADLNRSVSAEAFTTGSDIFFKQGKYAPGSDEGRRLLAHELTHVVQQRAGEGAGVSEVSHPDDPHEVEARQVADSLGSAPTSADRQPLEEEEEMLQPSVDRQEELPEEELAMSVDRQEMPEEEEMVMSVDRQPLEEEEEMLQPSVDRQEELPEEELAMSVDRQPLEEEEEMLMPSVDRQEELPEEELAMSVDRQEMPEEEDEYSA